MVRARVSKNAVDVIRDATEGHVIRLFEMQRGLLDLRHQVRANEANMAFAIKHVH